MMLNGWQRLGVVLSALWLLIALFFDPFEISSADVSGWEVLAKLFLQILAFWVSAYAALFAFRWVRKGFLDRRKPVTSVDYESITPPAQAPDELAQAAPCVIIKPDSIPPPPIKPLAPDDPEEYYPDPAIPPYDPAPRESARAALVASTVRRLSEKLTVTHRDPWLGSLNGCGGTFYGHTDADPLTTSYVTTNWLCFVWLPLVPLRRYRVIQGSTEAAFLGSTTMYSVLGELPLRRVDWIVALLAWIGLIGMEYLY